MNQLIDVRRAPETWVAAWPPGIKNNRQAMGTLDKAVKGGDGGDVKDDVQLATVLVWGRPHR